MVQSKHYLEYLFDNHLSPIEGDENHNAKFHLITPLDR